MHRSAIAGLNIVHTNDAEASGPDNLLDSTPVLDQLGPQLDLWTTFAFQSDEAVPGENSWDADKKSVTTADADPSNSIANLWDAINEAHPGGGSAETEDQLKSDTSIFTSPLNADDNTSTADMTSPAAFDLGAFFSGFAVDPFIIPPAPMNPLLSVSTSNLTIVPPSKISTAVGKASATKVTTEAPPAKRARKSDTGSETSSTPSIISHFPDPSPNTSTPVSTAEDKRRRNTAASARFRAKKKEREIAVEKRSKNLESRVADLERECEALKRENGWLKGLVVGSSTTLPTGPAAAASTAATVAEPKRNKRRREEATNA